MIDAKDLGKRGRMLLLTVAVLLLWVVSAPAEVVGTRGIEFGATSTFNLTAKADHITTGEGNSVFFWGFTDGDTAQYPGPTMIVDEGDVVTVNLTNELPVPVSIVFPGQAATASGGVPGLLTNQAVAAGGTVSYSFTAGSPGTYMYQSGNDMDLQTEMGLFGAFIVRPAVAGQAYNTVDSAYDAEYLFLMSEMDPTIHELVELGLFDQIDMTSRYAVYWFINGRNGPDTLLDNFVSWLPTQPYNCLPRINPGKRLLLRMIGAGMDGHPYHTHGNNITVIAKDGRLLSSAPGAGADLAFSDFTQSVWPGETYDAIFTWTGEKTGWDIYGTTAINPHTCVDGNADDFDDTTWEYCPDHDKPIPVQLPGIADLTFSPFYSGSPYLGNMGDLPPGEGGFNQNGGFYYMWHSHSEKELTNFDIFPGGMLTFLIVEPPSVTGIQ